MIILETNLTTLLVLFLILIFTTSSAAVENRYGRMRHENGKVDRPYFRGRQNTWACNVYPYTSSVTLRLDNVWVFILDLHMVIYIAFKYNNAIFLSRRFVEKRVNIQQIIFMKSDDIICVTLSFGFFIFNIVDKNYFRFI